MTSYVLVRREGHAVYYWQYGTGGGWTHDVANARRYADRRSAMAAHVKLIQRPSLRDITMEVEPITEKR